MTVADYNTTVKPKIEQLINSHDSENCEIACQIIKGLDFPTGLKIRALSKVRDTYMVFIEGLQGIETEAALSRVSGLIKKAKTINGLILELAA